MSVTRCILGKAESGLIDKKFAEEHVKKIENMEKAWEKTPANSMEKRLIDFANQLKHEADVKKLQLLREVETQSKLRKSINANRKGKVEGLKSTLTYDLRGDNTGLNIDKLSQSIKAQSFAGMQDIVLRLSIGRLGAKQDKKLAGNMVRALFGEESDEMGRTLAKQFSETAEKLRQRFNNAGGDFPEMKGYHLPQSHDSVLLNQVSADEWVEFTRPLIDKTKMIDFETGNIMSETKLDEVLRESYETLRTRGLNKMVPGQSGKPILANKYKEQRILHFKDSDSWLQYNQRFGNDDVYKTLVDYVDNMGDDIAMLEIYGPNPEKTKRLLVDEIKKEVGTGRDRKLKDKTTGELAKFETLWEDVTGSGAIPANPRVAKVNSEIRSLMTSAQLGSAFLTQLSDITTNALTAKFNGIPTTEVFKNYKRLMTSNKYRDFSVHLGLGAEELTQTLGSVSRYSDTYFAEKGWGSKASQFVMRASLLDRMTMASKKAFALDFTKFLADSSTGEFSKLNKGIRSSFERYGITEADWKVMAKSKFDNFDGAKYLNLRQLADENLEVARKFQNMIFTEQNFAVIDSNARTRAFMVGGSEAGSFWGEARRYFAMYKTFPITMLSHHLNRIANLNSATSKAGYAAAMFVPMTFAGALTVQAKNLVNGKKTQPMNNWKFWAAAAAAGGAAGLIGDFLFSEESRTGNSMIANLVGPGGSLIEDTWKITGGAAKRKLAGEDVAYPSEVLNTLRRYTPGNNLWYTKLAFERLIFDQASLAIDPKAVSRFNRLERQLQKDYDTGYWWRPGRTTPNF